MRLATVSHEGRSDAARLEDGTATLLDAADVGASWPCPEASMRHEARRRPRPSSKALWS